MSLLAGETSLRFDDFRLDLRDRTLSRVDASGMPAPVTLGSRAFEILRLLVGQRGGIVSKQAIMDAVWPNLAVEENNLTVQISALRRVLDVGRVQGSCIQTIPGRGYRFLPATTTEPDLPEPNVPDPNVPDMDTGTRAVATPAPDTGPQEFQTAKVPGGFNARARPRRPLLLVLTAVLIVFCLGVGALVGWDLWGGSRTTAGAPPRLSIVVLPFQDLSGNPAEDYLADGITDDLTTDLSHIPEAFVIARESAYTYKGKPTDVRQIGRELGVRYVLEGSVRKLGTTLRVNAQLVSTETGVHLWSDRFDEDVKDLADGQQRVVARMWSALGISMVDIERTRSQRERPTNPDAFDLILQARALRNLPPTAQRTTEALALYERALLLDPGSALAMASIVYLLPQKRIARNSWMDLEAMERAEKLLAQALVISPLSEDVLRSQLYLLMKQDRWKDGTAAAQQFIQMFPNSQAGYNVLAICKTYTGHAEEEIALAKKAIQLNPRGPYLFHFYSRLGFASLMLGRDADAISFLERSLAIHPDVGAGSRQNMMRKMAAAYGRMGEIEKAHQALAEANRVWPFDSVRSHSPDDPTSRVYAQQIRSYQEGLRRAGLRDHADEDADLGVASDAKLHRAYSGLTPTTAPGARTIRTGDLVALLAERKPLVIDPMTDFWGQSIPGAVGLKHAGAGGSLSGTGQERLRRKMAALTGGDLSKPIVAVGWNSERFDGRNLALRLVAMGYTNVYWYRGGREAWEVAGLPETELAATDW
jgi:adenylate cyclase